MMSVQCVTLCRKRIENVIKPTAAAGVEGIGMNIGNRLLGCAYSVRIASIFAAVPAALAICVGYSWVSDNAILREKALAVTAGLTDASARITAINNWVYHNQGFGKNNHFFVAPALGPTPNQVLESGGDCADKSRLVSAMLRELGIDSGLAQIFPCATCYPIHVVVEAEYDGGRMVVDPIWNIEYPAGDGRYLGIRDLAGTSRGRDHLAELQRERPTDDKIQRMPPAEATFDFARAVNWQKNFGSRTVASALTLLGYDPEELLRPRFLEDPKLAMTLCLLAVAVMLIVAGGVVGLACPSLGRTVRLPLRLPLKGMARVTKV
jgi:hypothetical protein